MSFRYINNKKCLDYIFTCRTYLRSLRMYIHKFGLSSRKTSHVFLSNKNSSLRQERLKKLRKHVPFSPTSTKKGHRRKSNHQFVIYIGLLKHPFHQKKLFLRRRLLSTGSLEFFRLCMHHNYLHFV